MKDTSVLREQVKQFVEAASEQELQLLYRFFEMNKGDWWDEINEEQKVEIEAAIKEADEGKTVSHDDMVKQYHKWLKK